MGKPAAPVQDVLLRKRLVRIARLMDSSIRVPVIGKRIGWDAVLGLVPGVGDIAGALIAGYIVIGGRRLGVPAGGVARMLGNVGLEMLIGAVPVVGDLFDMAFRANERNVSIIERYVGPDEEPQKLAATPEPTTRGSSFMLYLLGTASVVAAGALASRLLASTL